MTPYNTESHPPVAIVGGGLGGLSAAIHLRLAGFHVTLFESNPAVGGRASQLRQDGFSFDIGPTLLNYPWVFEQLFAAAGRRLEDYATLLPVDPAITFRWPAGERFQLSGSLCQLVGEVERLDPGGASGLLAFLSDAAEKYRISFDKLVCRNAPSALGWFAGLAPGEVLRLRPWRSLERELGRFFRDRHIREALGSYAMYMGSSPRRLPAPFSILPYGELALGLWLPRGGIYGLIGAVERLARELGVVIRTGQRVRRIVARGGAAAGVELEDGGFAPFRAIVSNVDVPTTLGRMIHHEGPRANGARPRRQLRMTPSLMTFYWGVRTTVAGAGHHTIFLPADLARTFEELIEQERIPREIAFFMSIASKTDPALAPPGCSAVYVNVPLPLLSRLKQAEGRDWEGLKKDLRGRILARLACHGIALEAGDILTEHILTPEDWAGRFGLHDGSALGAAHTLFQMGPLRYPNRDPKIRGVYYVGASTTPGTGLPMVTLGGKMTAERVIADWNGA